MPKGIPVRTGVDELSDLFPNVDRDAFDPERQKDPVNGDVGKGRNDQYEQSYPRGGGQVPDFGPSSPRPDFFGDA